jgi:hypothetical protein
MRHYAKLLRATLTAMLIEVQMGSATGTCYLALNGF